MNNLRMSLVIMILFFLGCGKGENPVAPDEVTKTGKIVVNVTWPKSVNVSKTVNISRENVDIITAYIYSTGREITHKNLSHEGNQGVAVIIVPAGNNYRFELVAFESWFDHVLYVGLKDSINIIADETTEVNITMVDAAPTLYSAEITGDNSFTISWSSVPLASSYMLEESTTSDFTSEEAGYVKLSKNVYFGSETTVKITNKPTGFYYYIVLAITQYDPDNLNPYNLSEWEKSFYDFNFNLAVNYGAISEIRTVDVGATGTLKIKIPWPG